jgi:ubiquinone/menaquinone biosynthesis C-methylase UbiE
VRDFNLQLLCDPDTKEPLYLKGNALCTAAATERYPVRDGVPVFAGALGGASARFQRLYDRLAPFYDSGLVLARWWMGDFRWDYLQELEVKSGGNVLEVSVGTADNLRYLREDINFVGIDISWNMLRRARRNVRRWGLEADFVQGEAERLPFCDAAFDVVFHVGGINFFDDPGQAMQEMCRVAKPGSKIVIVDETERVVRRLYERLPLLRGYFRSRLKPVVPPVASVPARMLDVCCREASSGRLYCLTFHTPGTPSRP